MKSVATTAASRDYAQAHETHYTAKHLGQALALYRALIDAYPSSQEAGYAVSQIQNIVLSVVPQRELFDAQVQLAVVHLPPEDVASKEPAPATTDSTAAPQDTSR